MNEIMEEGIIEETVTNPVRSEASRKAWDTRRAAAKAKAEAMKAETGLISAQQASELKDMAQRLFELREEFASIQDRLMVAETQWDAKLESITAK